MNDGGDAPNPFLNGSCPCALSHGRARVPVHTQCKGERGESSGPIATAREPMCKAHKAVGAITHLLAALCQSSAPPPVQCKKGQLL